MPASQSKFVARVLVMTPAASHSRPHVLAGNWFVGRKAKAKRSNTERRFWKCESLSALSMPALWARYAKASGDSFETFVVILRPTSDNSVRPSAVWAMGRSETASVPRLYFPLGREARNFSFAELVSRHGGKRSFFSSRGMTHLKKGRATTARAKAVQSFLTSVATNEGFLSSWKIGHSPISSSPGRCLKFPFRSSRQRRTMSVSEF